MPLNTTKLLLLSVINLYVGDSAGKEACTGAFLLKEEVERTVGNHVLYRCMCNCHCGNRAVSEKISNFGESLKYMTMENRLIRFFMAAALFVAAAAGVQAQTKVVAHRGYWKTDGSAQNSIASFVKADSIGAYGSEFDVWLTADNQLVVNHDRVFKGVNFPESTMSDISKIRLDNGESVPTLEEYLTAARKHPDIRLVLEVKTHGNDSVRQTLACRKIVDMVNEYKLQNRIDYIAFSLFACKELHRLSPETSVYYLNGDLSPEEIKKLGFAGIDYSYKAIQKHPEWINEAKNLGLEVNVWTVDDPEMMKDLIRQNVDYITTNHPEELQQLLNKK